MLTKKLLITAAFLAFANTTQAHAADVLWSLQGVTFADGGSAAGNFTYDADTNLISNFSVSVTGGNTSDFPAFTWNGSTATATYDKDFITGPRFVSLSSMRELRLDPVGSLTNAGGTLTLDLNSQFGGECYNCAPFRAFTAGSLVARVSAVPEPATWGLMLLGFAAAGAQFRRRRIATAILGGA